MDVNQKELKSLGKLVYSSAHRISFFIHDMIDFGHLTEKSENFRRNIQRFDLSDALNFVHEIFEPTIRAKNIDFTLKLNGFEQPPSE